MSSRFKDRKLYRSRDGILLGVCRGFAEYIGASVLFVRILAFILMMITGFWPFLVGYLVSALFIKLEPVVDVDSDTSTPNLDRLRGRIEGLNSRIRRVEDSVVSREALWEQRLNG